MRTYLASVTGFMALLWAGGLLSGMDLPGQGFWAWRGQTVLFSGILLLTWMALAMLLAVRPAVLDRRLGLDKVYRLHKWAGIAAGVLVVLHWGAERVPKWLAQAGVLARPLKRGAAAAEPALWVDWAKLAGEWAGYALAVLVVVALWKRVPFRAFRWVHKAMAVVFLAGAVHGAAMLAHRGLLGQPVAWVTLAAAAAGAVAAVLSLSGLIGRRRRVPARVTAVSEQPGGVLEVRFRPEGTWRGHDAGQFVFVTFDRAEGAHPFTIASPWAGAGSSLRLLIKPLGDYTRTLAARLRPGDPALLEGPYGRFDFADQAPRQVWVAGGVGVTPFLARLGELAAEGGGERDIDFFYSVRSRAEAAFPADLPALCRRAGVRLHLHVTDEDGLLGAGAVARRLGEGASVWFCGPAAWARSLKRALRDAGLPAARFHRELFEFR